MKKYRIHYCDYNYDEDHEEKEEIVETNLDGFFEELFDLYEKYNVSISHEDGYGGFMLEKDDAYNRRWIGNAGICRFLGTEESAYSETYEE